MPLNRSNQFILREPAYSFGEPSNWRVVGETINDSFQQPLASGHWNEPSVVSAGFPQCVRSHLFNDAAYCVPTSNSWLEDFQTNSQATTNDCSLDLYYSKLLTPKSQQSIVENFKNNKKTQRYSGVVTLCYKQEEIGSFLFCQFMSKQVLADVSAHSFILSNRSCFAIGKTATLPIPRGFAPSTAQCTNHPSTAGHRRFCAATACWGGILRAGQT